MGTVAAAGLMPAAASARPAPARALCVDVVTVRDAPWGYAIGYLHRPRRLTVLADASAHRWLLVREVGGAGLSGWIPRGALCPARRATHG